MVLPAIQADSYLDIHCHRSAEPQHVALVNEELTAFKPIGGRAVCSLGIHPWSIEGQNINNLLETLTFSADYPAVLAIGECGLDRAIATPISQQIDIFSQHILLAERLKKPLIIHCVRAYAEVLQLKKHLQPAQAWIMHGFSGKPALAGQLLQHGCYLSFGQGLLRQGPAQDSLASTPVDCLFLETDAAHDVSISEIYAVAAKILALDVATLRRQIVANFHRVFMHD